MFPRPPSSRPGSNLISDVSNDHNALVDANKDERETLASLSDGVEPLGLNDAYFIESSHIFIGVWVWDKAFSNPLMGLSSGNMPTPWEAITL